MAEWSASTLWWLVAGGLVAAELITGTFYLLMLAHRCRRRRAGGACRAGQHRRRWPRPRWPAAAPWPSGTCAGAGTRTALPLDADPDLNLDIGASVQVAAWQADGTCAGAATVAPAWEARYRSGHDVPQPGEHVIQAVQGTRLLLVRRPAPA